jgi:hypothetical protein
MTDAPDPDQPDPRGIPIWIPGLVRLMDDALGVPGTRYRIGWDALAGFFVPFVGDAVSALSHLVLLWAAFRIRAPRIVIARMTINAAIDIVTGAVPLLGDLFDVAFKANRKNLELLERAQRAGQHATRGSDYLVVAGAVLAVLLAMLVPLVLAGWVITKLVHHLHAF